MAKFFRWLFWTFAPFILVAAGAGLVWLGLELEVNFLLWAGGITALTGFGWGAILVLVHSEGGGFD